MGLPFVTPHWRPINCSKYSFFRPPLYYFFNFGQTKFAISVKLLTWSSSRKSYDYGRRYPGCQRLFCSYQHSLRHSQYSYRTSCVANKTTHGAQGRVRVTGNNDIIYPVNETKKLWQGKCYYGRKSNFQCNLKRSNG